jgi:hypothetical protein
MNRPHISGLSLAIMSKEGKLSPQALSDRLRALAVPNAIQNLKPNTSNFFAFNGAQS